MPTPSLPDEVYQQAVDTLARHGGNKTRAAKSLGIAVNTFRSRLEVAQKRQIKPSNALPDVEYPDIPGTNMETDELISHLKNRFDKRRKAEAARQWMPFKVNIKGPFGLAYFGDPHMDDNGCNIPLLERDLALVRDTEAMWGVGMGDYTNNWAGRLSQKIHPYQEVTRPHAWQLAEWFFDYKKPDGSSIWWLLIKGNHDQWSNSFGTGDPLDWMERGRAPLEEWQAKFRIVCPNGREVRVWAAHDFPGSSMYNPLHGPMRKARFSGAIAGLFVCGDKHHWALFETEHHETGVHIWCARARGYKFIDDYAERLGHEPQQYGATIATVINPDAEGPTAMRCFPDLAEACDFLNFLRRRK